VKPTFLNAAALGLAPIGLVLWGSIALAQTAAEPAQPAEPAAEAAEAAAPSYTIESALAVVDGVNLSLGELIAIRRELPEQYQALPDKVLFDGIVEQLIDQMLLAEAGRKAGLDRRPAVAANLLNQQRAILADAYLRQAVGERVTLEAVEALYTQLYLDSEPAQEVRAGHILVETEETAIELKAQLDAGADFALLAAEHGTDGTTTQGGDLGWFVHSDMVPEFADAAFAMEPGTIGDPVKTEFGWHLIKLDEKRNRYPARETRTSFIFVTDQEIADDLYRQLTEGADFTLLVNEQVGDDAEVIGGDLGDIGRDEVTPDDDQDGVIMMRVAAPSIGDLPQYVTFPVLKSALEAAMSLEVGTFSEPVESPNLGGWYIMYAGGLWDRYGPPLDEVREELMGELIQQAQTAVVASLRMQSAIVMPEPPLPPQSIRDDAMLEAAE
jgi:peptidyl-prolyl cis-trans isomerase C